MHLGFVMKNRLFRVRILALLMVMTHLLGCESMFLSPPIQGYSGEKRSAINVSRIQFNPVLERWVANWKITIDKINLPPGSMGLDLLPGKHLLYLRFEEAEPYKTGDCSNACVGLGECFHWECVATLAHYQCEGAFETVGGIDLVVRVTSGQEFPDRTAAEFRKKITNYMVESIHDESNKAIPCKRLGHTTRSKSYYDSHPPSRW